ncbi:MAG: hypothetical protein U0165_20065 [Polyangiaceae bacterium]
MARSKKIKAETSSTVTTSIGSTTAPSPAQGSPISPQGEGSWEKLEALLAAMLPELIAVDRHELVPNRLPAFELIASVRIWTHAAQGLLPAMADELKHPPTDEFASLPGLLDVAGHLAISIRPVSQKNIKTLTETELMPARRLLRTVVEMLTVTGHMSPDVLQRAQEGRSPTKVSKEVLVLIGALRAIWPQIEHKVAIDVSMLDAAESKAHEVLELSLRAASEVEVVSTDLDREDLLDRALTLILQRYNKIRKAVQYVRADQGDADSFTPSPYILRRRSSKANGASADSEDTGDTETPATPAWSVEAGKQGQHGVGSQTEAATKPSEKAA